MSANIETLLFPRPLLLTGGLPLRVQMRERILTAIGSGLLQPGDRLPTMRALSVHLQVDLNTVQRAYAELERLGAIETFRARGSFVSNHPPPPDPGLKEREVMDLAASTIARSHALGLEPDRVLQAMKTLLESSSSIAPVSGAGKVQS
ncbi:GntR family transcriptional regulator [Gluconobacter frateurii]|uniref:GntR family transcriptional regulator n=1 Tax=Gluconobacter frateurii TaxID=38308 RepID=UPI001F054874|nr:GntR family transcriptional regulator [Gluconobacter frateurii]UMM09487.1 GntR family transcriptional regulator [Gluconobacter frateurii]